MTVRVYRNGDITDAAGATISVFDRGFLYGDSVYEVLRTSHGHPVDLKRHLERLERSANALALTCPDEQTICNAIGATLQAADNTESYIRLIVTRGAGEVGLGMDLADEISFLVIVKELTLPDPTLFASGVVVQIVDVRRTSARSVDPAVKSGNYLNNILALAQAHTHKAYEAIMCDQQGFLAEGSSSNVFWVKDNTLWTPSPTVGILKGITRQRVMEIAEKELGMTAREGHWEPDALRGAEEAFLTSSIRGILPICQVDAKPLPQKVGPVTTRLMNAYEAFLEEEGRLPL